MARTKANKVPKKAPQQAGDLELRIRAQTLRNLRAWGLVSGNDPIAGWNTADLASALRAHANGTFSQSGRLSESMSCNPWIHDCLDKRMQTPTTLPLMVTPPRRSPQALLCADVVREIFPEVLSTQVLRQIHKNLLQMGFSAVGIDFELRTDGAREWIIPILKPWDPSLINYQWLQQVQTNRMDGGAYLATTMSHGQVVVQPGGGRWLLFENGTIRPWMNGYVAVLGETFLGDLYNFRDNMAFQDRFGRGILKLFYPDGMREEEVWSAADSLVDGGGGGVMPLKKTLSGEKLMDIDLVKADATGYQTFDSTEMRILRRILITYLGQDMTSMGQTGGFRQAVIHKEVFWNKREEDARLLGDAICSMRKEQRGRDLLEVREWIPAENVLRQQLWWWFAQLNFGDGALAPYTWWDATPPEDFELRSRLQAEHGEKLSRALNNLAQAKEKLQLSDKQLIHLAAQLGLDFGPVEEKEEKKSKRPVRRGTDGHIYLLPEPQGCEPYRHAAPRLLSLPELQRHYLDQEPLSP